MNLIKFCSRNRFFDLDQQFWFDLRYFSVFYDKGDTTMKVKEIMHKGVEWVSPDTLITVLAKKMKKFDVGALPVGENDRLIGMVTDRDIAVRALANGKGMSKLTARDVMTKGIIWCKVDTSAKKAARLMEAKQVRRLPVVDKDKRMVGMLSLGDICHAASQRTAAEVIKAVSSHHG
jgi:CBS domain-containing protein